MPPIRGSDFPLARLKAWSPFRLDALGLVTLLGADEVSRAVGSLTRNILTDYLPVFGAYKVASDQIATVEPGFAVYNVTDGVYVTELAPWFTRWLVMHLQQPYSVLKWSVESRDHPRRFSLRSTFAMVLGMVINGGLLAVACLQADWYGIANASSMIMSVLVRARICRHHRKAVDKVGKACSEVQKSKKKFLFVLPDGRVAIGYISASFIPAMLDNALASPDWRYLPSAIRRKLHLVSTQAETQGKSLQEVQPDDQPVNRGAEDRVLDRLQMWVLRALGWFAFGIQIVAVGQAFLATQLCTVAVMSAASVAVIYNIGVSHREEVGKWIAINQCAVPGAIGRRQAYAMLELTKKEKRFMRNRGLLPDESLWPQWYRDFENIRNTWEREKYQGMDEARSFLDLQ